jgi:hypothetical protein
MLFKTLIIKLNYFLCFFPAFSIPYFFVGIPAHSRLMSLALYPMLRYKQYRVMTPVLFFSIIFFLYFVVSVVDDERGILLYFAYFITFVHILYSASLVLQYPQTFISFFNIFFIANIVHACFQTIMLNYGYHDLVLLHSNSSHQVINNYIPPNFIGPLYRVTGLFGESSPFAFYLSIAFVTYLSLGHNYRWYKRIAVVSMLASGSKFGYLFLIIHYAFFSDYRLVRYLFFPSIAYGIYIFFFDFNLLSTIFFGRAGSLQKRFNESLESSSQSYSWFGTNLLSSSDGTVSLDFVNIFLHGFGYFGIIIFVILVFLFYAGVKSSIKKYFIPIFLLGLVSSGSLLILQYTLIVYVMIYFHSLSNQNYIASSPVRVI